MPVTATGTRSFFPLHSKTAGGPCQSYKPHHSHYHLPEKETVTVLQCLSQNASQTRWSSSLIPQILPQLMSFFPHTLSPGS